MQNNSWFLLKCVSNRPIFSDTILLSDDFGSLLPENKIQAERQFVSTTWLRTKLRKHWSHLSVQHRVGSARGFSLSSERSLVWIVSSDECVADWRCTNKDWLIDLKRYSRRHVSLQKTSCFLASDSAVDWVSCSAAGRCRPAARGPVWFKQPPWEWSQSELVRLSSGSDHQLNGSNSN